MARMTALGEEAANRRDAILEASLRLFAEQGVDSASMSDIARAVGITKATLYHYFAGKIEILEELIASSHYSTDELAETMSADSPLIDRVTRVAIVYIDVICAKPDLGHILLRESLGNAKHSATEEVKAKFVRRYMSRIEVMEACLRNEPHLVDVSDGQIRLFAEILFDSMSLFWLRRVLVQREATTEQERHEYAQGLVQWLLRSERLIEA